MKPLGASWIPDGNALGNEVKSLEEEFSAFHGEEFYAVGVANGTDAISLCLRTLGLGPGDEIITTSHTAVATIAGIEQAGCSPVFADIEGDSRCLSPESIERRIGKETRAIMPVHIYGQPCKMQKIMEIARTHGLEVIEDCSQAHGAEINGKKLGLLQIFQPSVVIQPRIWVALEMGVSYFVGRKGMAKKLDR